MGIASMVIGILAAILGFIPFCGYFAFIPAVVALILGIVDVVLKTKKGGSRGCGIAGIILNSAAILLIGLWTLIFAAPVVAGAGVGAAAAAADAAEKRKAAEKEKEAEEKTEKKSAETEAIFR